jgi:hypothetical protein
MPVEVRFPSLSEKSVGANSSSTRNSAISCTRLGPCPELPCACTGECDLTLM